MPDLPTKELDVFARPERLRELPRYRELSRLDAYYRGTQYDGRPDWWTGETGSGETVPLRERRPCVIYPLPRAAVNQATRFTCGEGRFPVLRVEPSEAEDALSPGMVLSDDEAEALTRLLQEIASQVRLKSRALEMLRRGLSAGTTPAILGVRRGRLTLDLPDPRDCFAEFVDGDPTAPVLRLVWAYSYEKTVEDANGNCCVRTFWFRRDVTAEEYVAYHDAPRPELPGMPVEWRRDEERTVRHGLGFCPVVWARNQPETSRDSIDGVSLYEGLEDEFDALNFALSQRHRGIHYFGTPQAYETGVSDDEQPGGPPLRPAKTPKTDDAKYPAAQAGPFGVNPKNRGRRPQAPDRIWSYKGDGVRLGILETTGAAFDAATKHVADVRARILEAIDVVLLDPTTVAGKGEISAKALAILFAPLLALVDELREQWWEDCLEKILSMFFRMIAVRFRRGKTGDKIGSLLLPGVERAAPLLERFWFRHESGEEWIPPRIIPQWGDYFSPSNDDVKAAIAAAADAKSERLVTGETATRFVASYMGVDDPAEEAEKADEGSLHAARKKLDEMAGDDADDVAPTEPPKGVASMRQNEDEEEELPSEERPETDATMVKRISPR
jgi:hypothetical protein